MKKTDKTTADKITRTKKIWANICSIVVTICILRHMYVSGMLLWVFEHAQSFHWAGFLVGYTAENDVANFVMLAIIFILGWGIPVLMQKFVGKIVDIIVEEINKNETEC